MTDDDIIEAMARAMFKDDQLNRLDIAKAALAVARQIIEAPLRAENEKLRAALKPFAEMHDKWWPGGVMFLPMPDEHTVLVEFIHLREAKEALNDPR